MYSNVPTTEVIYILELISTQPKVDTTITKELIKLTSTIMKQNYFTFHNNCYTQNDSLAMGASTSPTQSEVYFQHMEQQTLTPIHHTDREQNPRILSLCR